MRQNNRQRIFAFAALVDKMNSEAVNISAKMRETVEVFFLRPPIEFVVPITHEFFQISQIRAVVPIRALDFIRPARFCQAFPQVVKRFLRYV